MSKDSSAKYYQNNKRKTTKNVSWKILKSFWRWQQYGKKSNNKGVKNIKISAKMKNKY